jgi:hypothetical protein
MPLEDLLGFLNRAPFEPFRIHLTDGSSFDVRHRELCMPGARSVAVGIRDPNQPQIIYERLIQVALVHITRLEPIPAPAISDGNGQAS